MKRILCALFALVMMISIMTSVPLTAKAADSDKIEYSDEYYEEYGIRFALNKGKKSYRITSASDEYLSTFKIPTRYKGKPVTAIGNYAFEDNDGIEKVVIPETVKTIGKYAFSDCENLREIKIPNSVTCINEGTFEGCESLKKITLPDSITSIGESAFSDCENLTAIKLSKNLTSIGKYAFSCCEKLSEIKIPKDVTSIGSYIFDGCNALKAIKVDTNNKKYSSANGVLFNEGKTALLVYPVAKEDTSYSIPKTVKTIKDYAFFNVKKLTEITIPKGVTSIGYCAFSSCRRLKSITLPDSVTTIKAYAFAECTSLKKVKLSKNIKSIPEYAFGYCESLTSITIPDGVKSVGFFSFYDCNKLVTIKLPDSINEICAGAFTDTGYFDNQKNWSNGILYIGKHLVAARNNKKTVKIKEGTITIGDEAFWRDEKLESVVIPDSVENIGVYAFSGCESLKKITLSKNLKKLNSSAFYYTGYYNNPKNWEDGVLYLGNCLIATDGFTKSTYEIKKGTRLIVDYAFWALDNLKSIKVPASVKYINERALGLTGNDRGEIVGVKGFKLSGYKGSAAEKYAKKNKLTFVALAPEKPVMKAVSNTSKGIKITWKASEGADSYVVYRKTAGGSYKALKTVTGTSYTDTTAKNGKKYIYNVKAKNKAGYSGYAKSGLTITRKK